MTLSDGLSESEGARGPKGVIVVQVRKGWGGHAGHARPAMRSYPNFEPANENVIPTLTTAELGGDSEVARNQFTYILQSRCD